MPNFRKKRKTAGQAASAKALLAGLDRLPVAFALFDAARRLAAWNAPLRRSGFEVAAQAGRRSQIPAPRRRPETPGDEPHD
jgi:hypothetical protein